MTAKKAPEKMRKSTTEPHPLFGGNPAQYTDDVDHRPEEGESDQEKAPAAMAQRGRWSRQ